MPTKTDTDRRLFLARRVLIALWVVAVIAAAALASTAFSATQADWQFNQVLVSLDGAVSFETLTAVVTAARLLLTGVFLTTAGWLILGQPSVGSLVAALALLGLPFLFGITGEANIPAPWGSLLGGMTGLLGAVGMVALPLTLLLFPDGHFFPTRLRIATAVGIAFLLLGLVVSQFVDEAWLLLIIPFALLLLIGVGAQIARYRAADVTQRRQSIGFLAAMVGMLVWIVISFIGERLPLLNMVTGYVVSALLVSGLYLAARRGVWGKLPPVDPFAGLTAVVVLAALLASGLWWRNNRPVTVDAAAIESVAPIPVALDADMAMDDIDALLYLLRHPAIEIRAITINGVAFAHCDAGVRNTLGILEMAEAAQIPVSCGREDAFTGGRPAPDDWRRIADNLYGAQVVTGGRAADERPAAELLADTINAAPGEIVVLAVGPLTNLAEAFQADPMLPGRIREIIIMGGALDVPGNVVDADNANTFAEWNFFADPVAADIVLASGAPIVLVPLDATNDVPFTRGFYERLRADAQTRPAVFTYNLMYMNQWWLDGGMYWWDTLAAATLINPELVTYEEMTLDVVTDAGPEMGRSVVAPGGASVRVATSADARQFEALFLAVLNYE